MYVKFWNDFREDILIGHVDMERIIKLSVFILFPTQCTIHNLNVSVQYHHLQIFMTPQVPGFIFSGIQIMSETIHRQVISGNKWRKLQVHIGKISFR